MAGRQYFSADYFEARDRFRAAAEKVGATREAHAFDARGPGGEELTLDLAWLGPRDAERVVVVSSGLHGVEGFMGSAIQLALLDGLPSRHERIALVFQHALNPYGFAHIRRVDGENVDLNRNMLREGERYEGAPDGYDRFDALLNPPRPPGRLSPVAFVARALPHLAAEGMAKLKTIVAGGQYAFPKGLFFGGAGPTETNRLLAARVPVWFGGAKQLLQVDFHSGLGAPGTYKLLVDHTRDEPRTAWLQERFGAFVQPWDAGEGVAYAIRGGLGTWMQAALPDAEVDVLCAEFGTVNPIAVILALHLENRAHLYGSAGDALVRAAKQRLRVTFAPDDPAWRDTVVERGVGIVEVALAALR